MIATIPLLRNIFHPAIAANAHSLSQVVGQTEDSEIKISNLNVSIGNNHILKDINLKIPNNMWPRTE